MIRVTVQEGVDCHNFAWGVHGTSTNNNNQANWQQNNQDRDERKRRYYENRDCALDKRNSNRNVSDLGTQEPHWLYRNIERRNKCVFDSNWRYGKRDENNDNIGSSDSAGDEWW